VVVSQQVVVPKAIRRRVDGIEIVWPDCSDPAWYPARPLRLACPCAGCVDEMSHRPILDPRTVPADVSPAALDLVGAYGIKVHWSDGHGTGIYTFQALHDSPVRAGND